MKLSLRRIVAGVYIVLVLIVIVVAMWSTTHKVCCSHCCSVITDLPETADSDDHEFVMRELAANKTVASLHFPPDSQTVHIVLCVDKTQFPGLPTLMNSVLNSTDMPERILFHMIHHGEAIDQLKQLLLCHKLLDKVTITPFELPQELENSLGPFFTQTTSFNNLLYSTVSSTFSNLTHILYLEVDMVVQTDIGQAWGNLIQSSKLIVAVPHGRIYINPRARKLYLKRYNKKLNTKKKVFNGGIYGLNLKKWRALNLDKEVWYWMSEHAKSPLWSQAIQPIPQILAHNDWDPLDRSWNVANVDHIKSASRISQANIIHWNGPKKPWNLEDNASYRTHWTKYTPVPCNGHGECNLLHEPRPVSICTCKSGYIGTYCHKRVL